MLASMDPRSRDCQCGTVIEWTVKLAYRYVPSEKAGDTGGPRYWCFEGGAERLQQVTAVAALAAVRSCVQAKGRKATGCTAQGRACAGSCN